MFVTPYCPLFWSNNQDFNLTTSISDTESFKFNFVCALGRSYAPYCLSSIHFLQSVYYWFYLVCTKSS